MLRMLTANREILVVLALAFSIRGTAGVLLQRWLDAGPKRLDLIAGDAEGYWDLARKLTRGEDYSLYEPPRHVLRMPGFPLFLAASMIGVGERPWAIRWLLAAIGTAACGLTYILGRELFDSRVGFLAGLFAAFSPPLVLFSVLFLSETLFAVLMLTSLWSVARLVRNTSTPVQASAAWRDWSGWLWAGAAGIVMGLATLVRPTWILAGPAFAGLYMASTRPLGVSITRCAVLLLSCGMVLAPWVVRNWRVTGHFVPTTLWVGASLYDGLNPDATGASDMRFIKTDGIYARVSEYDADRHYRHAAWEFVKTHPLRTLELGVLKLRRFWRPWPQSPEFEKLPVQLILSAAWGAQLIFAACGGWIYRGRLWICVLTAGPILYFSLVHAVFVGSIRYRIPGEYALCVLSAAGVYGLVSHFRGVPRQVVAH
jgi:4-amino-4-deoxy-L-arabinose transferase-like glycosyltransferase